MNEVTCEICGGKTYRSDRMMNQTPVKKECQDKCGILIHWHHNPFAETRAKKWIPTNDFGEAVYHDVKKAETQVVEKVVEKVVEVGERVDLEPIKRELEALKRHDIDTDTDLARIAKKVTEIEANLAAEIARQPVVVTRPESPEPVTLGRVHKQFEDILREAVAISDSTANTMALTGPAGSGKTTIGKQLAQALDLPFFKIALSPHTTESRLIGFENAKGEWVNTAVFLAFAEEHGAFLLIDEIDAGNSGANVTFNSLFDNDEFMFGVKRLMKSARFFPCVTLNTYGWGADIKYVGRNALDGATRDRLRPMIRVDYDWDLVADYNGRDEHTIKAINYVANLDLVVTANDQLIFGPRAATGLAKSIRNGTPWEKAIEFYVWSGVKTDVRERLLSNVTNVQVVS